MWPVESYCSSQKGGVNMNSLSFALFSTFVALASAAYYESGPCPSKPPILAPFDVERVNISQGFVHFVFVIYLEDQKTPEF